MNNKIVITGITGTIAKYLIPGLIADGAVVTALSRRPVAESYGAMVLEGDLGDARFVNQALTGVDTVIHAAALTRSANPAELKKSNEDITATLVNASLTRGVNRFLFFSSDLAHNPVGPYGRSKLACERIITDAPLTDWAIFRLSPFLGSNGAQENSTFSKFIETARSGRRLWLPDGGEFTVAPICAADLDRLVRSAVAHQGCLRKVYSVTGDQSSLRELILKAAVDARIGNIPIAGIKLAVAILALLPIRLPMIESLQTLGRSPNSTHQALESDFGFVPSTLDSMLQQHP